MAMELTKVDLTLQLEYYYCVLELMIIGGGKMGQSLAHGILDSKAIEPASLGIVEVSEKLRNDLKEVFPHCQISPTPLAASSAILAIKPTDVESVATSLADESKNRILSIAAGVPTPALEVWLGGKVPVIRAMPNTPSMLGLGMTALCAGRFAGDEDLEWAKSLMLALGRVVIVKESQFDAITAVSGSGPAYIFLAAEAMIDAAVKEGLSLGLATELVTQTIYGSGAMLASGTSSPTELRQNVTSPGGTTAAGLAVLEAGSVRTSFANAVAAAKIRSKEIASELFKH